MSLVPPESRVLISFIIPAYNESQNIQATIQEALRAVPSEYRAEFIVVDDHSSDSTFESVNALQSENIHCLRLSRRSGSHSAIRAGLRYAGGEAAICLAADGQDNPTVIPRMLEKWTSGFHTVWALRKDRNDEPLSSRLINKTFYKILRMVSTGGDTMIDFSRADFFLMDRQVVQGLNACGESNTSVFGLISWLGFSQACVEYERRPRVSGSSKWNLRNRVRLARDWIVAFSGVPLKMMTLVGMVLAFVGLCYAAIVVWRGLKGTPVPGWSSLMVAVLTLGGFQIFLTGLVGEYLWRALEESRKRPLFFVEKTSVSLRNARSRTLASRPPEPPTLSQ